MARVVRFMLFRCHEKPDVPAKRKELTDLVQVRGGEGGRGRESKGKGERKRAEKRERERERAEVSHSDVLLHARMAAPPRAAAV